MCLYTCVNAEFTFLIFTLTLFGRHYKAVVFIFFIIICNFNYSQGLMLLFYKVVVQQLINSSVKQTFGRAAAPPQRSQSLLPIITLLASSTIFFSIGHLFCRVSPLFSHHCSKKINAVRIEVSIAFGQGTTFFFPLFSFFFVKTNFIFHKQLRFSWRKKIL